MRSRPEGAVRLAGGQGFYGDAPGPIEALLTEEPDYVVLEALAELMLSSLAKDRLRDETLGWTRDLPRVPAAAAAGGARRPDAGDHQRRGINPLAATRMVVDAARRLGLTGVRVATVVGDDLRGRPELLSAAFPAAADLLFANGYLGARPVVEALEAGADIVVTGRVADAALFCAPLVHHFGWERDDWDRRAAGMVVGHLLACSGQATGGNHAGRWWQVPEPWRFGFPLADVTHDGSATIFAPEVAGGQATFDSVRQQLLYEVHDPAAYLTPDVVVDMTTHTGLVDAAKVDARVQVLIEEV